MAPIKPENVEAGTGYYEKRFVGPEIKPDFGKVTVTKVDEGVAWGSVHWQYMEDISKITPHEGTPLKIKKTLASIFTIFSIFAIFTFTVLFLLPSCFLKFERPEVHWTSVLVP